MIALLILFGIISSSIGYPSVDKADPSTNDVTTYDFRYVTRAEWQAKTPVQTTPLKTPVPYVVIHHTYIPGACHTREQCSSAMRGMQNYNMIDNNWWDIGYNFAVGGDGAVYEGRGWTDRGAHSLHFNNISIGISFIGDYRFTVPSVEQIAAAKSLIATGVELGFVKPAHKIIGHRQVRRTACPGDALYELIKTWDKYSPFPGSIDDLDNVEELKKY
ncbi:peptidoglycan-recognition protein LB-like [Bombyx mandarina]|uniref:Peptidoglycan-recognition protein n=1 Tax=Bombyx mandarina TaxID=7092 RepID=A0A6J2K2U2_BOMMA|nr:peptidoglycan-recognition protein LB-like [Bombyx mandarina]XP_028035323.1 peptidoglycan-recognition protein LB-like [Bombyx mandarina]